MKETKSPIRLQRIVIAALLAELIPLIVLVAVITCYAYLVSPGLEKGSYKEFSDSTGKIINLVAGTLATFGMAYWAARKPETSKVMHGALTGLVVVFIELAILASPETSFSLIEGIGMLTKLLAGTLGGYAALYHYRKNPTAGHRIM